MIGSNDRARSSGFMAIDVRIASNANARPSRVVAMATKIARVMVFQATPHWPPAMHRRLQIDGSVSLVMNRVGANAPLSSRKAELSTVTTGQNTNIAKVAPIASREPVTNT